MLCICDKYTCIWSWLLLLFLLVFAYVWFACLCYSLFVVMLCGVACVVVDVLLFFIISVAFFAWLRCVFVVACVCRLFICVGIDVLCVRVCVCVLLFVLLFSFFLEGGRCCV